MREERKVEADIRTIARELGLDLEKMWVAVFGKEPVGERQT
jgi:hypothetical protein